MQAACARCDRAAQALLPAHTFPLRPAAVFLLRPQSQLTIDSFLTKRERFAKIRSKRLQKVGLGRTMCRAGQLDQACQEACPLVAPLARLRGAWTEAHRGESWPSFPASRARTWLCRRR